MFSGQSWKPACKFLIEVFYYILKLGYSIYRLPFIIYPLSFIVYRLSIITFKLGSHQAIKMNNSITAIFFAQFIATSSKTEFHQHVHIKNIYCQESQKKIIPFTNWSSWHAETMYYFLSHMYWFSAGKNFAENGKILSQTNNGKPCRWT